MIGHCAKSVAYTLVPARKPPVPRILDSSNGLVLHQEVSVVQHKHVLFVWNLESKLEYCTLGEAIKFLIASRSSFVSCSDKMLLQPNLHQLVTPYIRVGLTSEGVSHQL